MAPDWSYGYGSPGCGPRPSWSSPGMMLGAGPEEVAVAAAGAKASWLATRGAGAALLGSASAGAAGTVAAWAIPPKPERKRAQNASVSLFLIIRRPIPG